MIEKVKLAAVSYLNTIPFIYGIEQSELLLNSIDLRLEFPSKCADLLKSGQVDIGLIPVAEIPNIPNAQIISDYCIGADGKVNTVMLYSHCPLHDIDTIALDYQSRTSAKLIKILASEFWKIDVQFNQTSEGYIDQIQGKNAGLVIGDRAFDLNGKFPYQYYLSEEWYKFTGLPFVFACWVANKPLSKTFTNAFDKATAFGIQNKSVAIRGYSKAANVNLVKYLNEDISYHLDTLKRKALELFLDYIKSITVE